MFSIGIDIGSYSVKVAKVRSTNRGYELLNYLDYPLTQDPNKDTQIDIIEILRDVKSKLWEEGTQIVVGAHQYEVSLRRREFPFRERHKILRSLPFELEDDIPFSAENSVFDAKITHYVGNTAHILACACPKEHLLQILKRVGDGGIHPDIVSVDGIAGANLFEEWREAPWEYPATSETASSSTAQVDLVINIGHRTTTVGVIKDGYLLDIRLVDWGGKDLTEVIAAKYNLHYLEALKELRKKAFILTNNDGATRDQIALSEVIKTGVDGLAQKLRLALLEMKTLHNLDYRQAILIGGVAQLRNLGPYLTQKLEVATNRLGHLDMLGSLDFSTSPNNEIAMVTAIGLAVEGIKRPKNPALNLLKGDFAKQSQYLRLFWDKWSHGLQVLGLAFGAILVWAVMRESFSTSNAELANEQLRTHAKNIIGLKGAKVSERNIKTFIREQEQKLKLKEMLEDLQGLNSGLDVVKRISSLAPNKNLGGLNIRLMKISGETVAISGEASRVEVLNELQKALKSLSKDGKIQSSTPPAAATAGYKSFAYSLRVERKTGGN